VDLGNVPRVTGSGRGVAMRAIGMPQLIAILFIILLMFGPWFRSPFDK
jgi:hypothetical protein